MSYLNRKNNQNYINSPCKYHTLQPYIDYSLYELNPYKNFGGGNNQNFSLEDPQNPASYISKMVNINKDKNSKESYCGGGRNQNLSLEDPQNMASYDSIITEKYCTGSNKVLSLQDPYNIDSYNAYYTKNAEYFELQKKGTFVLFYADWCHYCKEYMPLWENIKEQNMNKYNFVKIKEKDIGSVLLNNEKIKNKIKELSINVRGFPTIIYIYNDKMNPNILNSYFTKNRNEIIKEIQQFE